MGGEGDDRGWDSWMASPTWWAGTWVSSGSWWWTGKPDLLQSMGSLRVGHDWAASLSFSLSCIGEGNGNPLQCSCLENPRDGGACWAAIYGVRRSQTRLKRLSSSSSSSLSYMVVFVSMLLSPSSHLFPPPLPVMSISLFCMSVLVRTYY